MATLEQIGIQALRQDINKLQWQLDLLELRLNQHLEQQEARVDQTIGTVEQGAVVTGLKIGRIG